MGATPAGLILGTAAYMAPEQARGKSVDKRADIWAFGVVLYEMLTGRRPFDGEDVSTILAAVIQSEPRWDGIPPSMLRLLKTCLEKDPKRRLRDIGDMWDMLDDAPASTGSELAIRIPRLDRGCRAGRCRGDRPVGAVAKCGVPVDRPLVRLEVDLGSDRIDAAGSVPTPSSVAISPDGTRLAYVARISGGPPRLLTQKARSDERDRAAGR